MSRKFICDSWFVLQVCHIFESDQYLATWFPPVVAWMAIDLLYFGCQMLLLLIQAGRGLFPSLRTFTNFLLTEFELFFVICCRSWINSIWCRIRVKKRIWETKIISSNAKSWCRDGIAFVTPGHCHAALWHSFPGVTQWKAEPWGPCCSISVKLREELTTPEMSPTGRGFKLTYLED